MSSSFVGRKQEITDIWHLFADEECRLITLTGPGGIGKTRLALAVAEQAVTTSLSGTDLNRFPNGIIFVNLQPLIAAENILPAIASAIGFQFYEANDPQQQVLDFLRDKKMLLILDNFEHLLDGVALVDAILAHAPDI
jgi:predicted ATPase